MKHALSLIAIALACSVSSALAQPAGTAGFSLGANVEFSQNNGQLTGAAAGSANSTGLGLQAQYSIPLGTQFLVGLGLDYSPSARDTGVQGSAGDVSLQNAASLDLQPSYILSDSMTIYAKLAALSATASAANGSNLALSGYGYGLGLRSMLDRNLYWQLGYDSNRYGDTSLSNGTGLSISSKVFSLGLGYKF